MQYFRGASSAHSPKPGRGSARRPALPSAIKPHPQQSASKPPLAVVAVLFLSSRLSGCRVAGEMGSETFLEVFLAILLPPVGVFLRYGCGVEFWIDLLLTILGYIPGIIYAIFVLVG
ncbi:hypothetical protein Taro_035376 [Colocasia esculenta]|uniref:Uncharacterized protein n=1 Tax=Colocasia esculenta TaxID=4460 RepID=A0A843WEP8_COLES|nr:hypothetical protein [Colocasia esculenta]